MKEQNIQAANNNLKNKLALGVFSVAGLTATAGMMNTLTANADDTQSDASAKQNSQSVDLSQIQQYALPQQVASQASADNNAVPTGKHLLPSSTLDDAVKKAQDAGIDTQEVDGNTYHGTPGQYQDILDESDSDYADQVGNILAQITDHNGYNKKVDASNDQLEDLLNLVAKAQQSGVDVNQGSQKTGLNFSEIKDDYAAQIKALQDAINKKNQGDSDAAQSNNVVEQAAKDAENAGVEVTQDPSQNSNDVVKDAQDQVAALKAIKAQREADLKKWQAEVDQVKADNAAGQADYEAKLKEYNKAKADNEAAEKEYQKELEAYQKAEKEWNDENSHKDGFTEKGLSQALDLNNEPTATAVVTTAGDTQWIKNNQEVNQAYADPTLNNQVTDVNGHTTKWTRVKVGKGGSVTVTYTNLSNSKYENHTISKIVKTFTYDENYDDQPMYIDVPDNPSMNVWYNSLPNETHTHEFTRSVVESDSYYDSQDRQITFNDDAIITVGSLNNYFGNLPNNAHIEKAKVDNATFVPINKGTISGHADGYAYSDNDNTTADSSWDNGNSPLFYKGTAVFQLNNGTKNIVTHLITHSGKEDNNTETWAQSSTKVPGSTIKPAKPYPPTPDPKGIGDAPTPYVHKEEPKKPVEKISYHLYNTSAKVTANYHINQLPKDSTDSLNYHYNYSDITPSGDGGHDNHHDNGGNGGHDNHHDNGGNGGHDNHPDNGGDGGHNDNGGNHGHPDKGDKDRKHNHHGFKPASPKPVVVDRNKSVLPETGETAASTQTISTESAYFFGISAAMSLVAAFALRRKEQ
ncbi:GbpC/Spa domain-containing protein [Eupransor demetentiae]|uniref:Gram-positive cocci surface proteins LPxTG domain-containing protein n=1 Tax=Eupransor demetentiae TaxID=3109584 RepID=A0ABM9N3Z8_9LACO|nr:hypothetical protein R54876_GBNLAHCA_00437 [Lactobacillaceae bacterium LMG 33000]